MSWIERTVGDRLARAAAAGEVDAPRLTGKPLPDLDRPREQGWWAQQFVRRELSHDRRTVAEIAAGRARAGFWRATSVDELHDLVRDANAAIVAANLDLVEADKLDRLVSTDVRSRWENLRSTA